MLPLVCGVFFVLYSSYSMMAHASLWILTMLTSVTSALACSTGKVPIPRGKNVSNLICLPHAWHPTRKNRFELVDSKEYVEYVKSV